MGITVSTGCGMKLHGFVEKLQQSGRGSAESKLSHGRQRLNHLNIKLYQVLLTNLSY